MLMYSNRSPPFEANQRVGVKLEYLCRKGREAKRAPSLGTLVFHLGREFYSAPLHRAHFQIVGQHIKLSEAVATVYKHKNLEALLC